ncbi:hypothetical protein AKJ16_DCAP05141 [Drosera capensis]
MRLFDFFEGFRKAKLFQPVRASPRSNIVMTRSKAKQDRKNNVRINEPNALEGRGPQTGIDGAIVTGGAVVSDAENLDLKAQELFEYGASPEPLRISALFKAACPGLEFVDHLAGEMHMKMVMRTFVGPIANEWAMLLLQESTVLNKSSRGKNIRGTQNPRPSKNMDGLPGGKDQQEMEIPLPGWCEACKTKCCPQNLENHKMGKNHKKNLVKQKNPEDDVIAPTETQP